MGKLAPRSELGRAMMPSDRNNRFQHLVLNALWIVILCAMGKSKIAERYCMHNFRDGAIVFGDDFGTPGEEAKIYRRKTTYTIDGS